MVTKFNDQHLEAFQTKACPGGWNGRKLANWITHFKIEPLGQDVLSQSLTRTVLKELCADPNVPDRDCLWAILTHLLSRTPEETEQCLFSQGGRAKGKWRTYLLQNGG